jgi:hypothetical protein
MSERVAERVAERIDAQTARTARLLLMVFDPIPMGSAKKVGAK